MSKIDHGIRTEPGHDRSSPHRTRQLSVTRAKLPPDPKGASSCRLPTEGRSPKRTSAARWPTLSRCGAVCCDMPGRFRREANVISTGKLRYRFGGCSEIKHGSKATRWTADARYVFSYN